MKKRQQNNDISRTIFRDHFTKFEAALVMDTF